MKENIEEVDDIQLEKRSLLRSFAGFFRKVFEIGKIDYKMAIDGVKADVSFRGLNIWILICSVLICSLGLNLNSTAVVIGAMLISPLMGPINGFGMAIGTFDRDLLKRSLVNLGIATGVSILTAFIFFKITPTGDDLHELFSRKTPVVLDLFIAFFGGVAGILASTKRIASNVIPGVAIATALMPPLCTAGYGLATLQMDYFLGAFYLYFMNAVMISLAALLIVVYLKFPRFSYVNESTQRKVKRGIFIFIILFSVPSVVLYYNVIKNSREQQRVKEFVKMEVESENGIYLDNYRVIDNDSGKMIVLSVNGRYLSAEEIAALQERCDDYQLNDYVLKVIQNERILDESELSRFGEQFKVDLLAQFYEDNQLKLASQEDEIRLLQSEIRRLSIHNLATDKIAKVVNSQFEISSFAFDNIVYHTHTGLDTVPTALVTWQKNQYSEERENKLKDLLKIQLETEEIIVHSFSSE